MVAHRITGFQSVERICVPSNGGHAGGSGYREHVSIRRTDLCAFEPQAYAQGTARNAVSIRRTDLCAFELRRGTGLCAGRDDVSIRRTDLCAFERFLARLLVGVSLVSIRRTDLCAFERLEPFCAVGRH